MYIYVLDRNGKPLMPTTRCGKVRRLLCDGRAVVESHTPFTIRLTYDTTSFVQPVHLGLDAGSVHVGVSACTDRRELYAAEVELRTDIVSNIATRREARRTRRGKRTVRYRAPRFDNRRKPEGWLAPSVAQKVEQNVRAATHVAGILPVRTVTVEVAQFDMQLIKNPDIEGTGYQHGPQAGFWNTREYVLWRDGHECRCCHGKSKDKVLNVHHVESRKTGGDSPDNLVTLCETCHKAYHAGKVKLDLKRGSRTLRDAAAMNVMRWTVFHQLRDSLRERGIAVFYTYGYVTKNNRIAAGLAKGQAVDARCASGHPQAAPTKELYAYRKLRRHNRKMMKSNMLPDGRWKRNQAPREVKGFRLFDTVSFLGTDAYVHGRRSNGFFVVKDSDGGTQSNSASYKKVLLVRHNNGYMFNLKKRLRPIPPTNEFVGFLGQKS